MLAKADEISHLLTHPPGRAETRFSQARSRFAQSLDIPTNVCLSLSLAAALLSTDLISLKTERENGGNNPTYWPKYHPIPYRSKKLVIIVNEFA